MFTRTRAAAGAAGLLALMLTACDATDPFRDVTVEINFAPTAVQVSAELVNAATGAPVEASGIVVEVLGAPAGAVVDGAGAPLTRFTMARGFFSFGLKGAPPTSSSPTMLTLVASAPGYLTTTERVTLDATLSAPVRIEMVELARPPAGTSVIVNHPVPASASGEVTATTSITTPAEASTGATASVVLPQGTVVRDRTGTALSGELRGEIVYFNNRDEASLRAFPGGLQARVENLAVPEVNFVTGGFAAVELRDAAGRQAATFSAPVQLSIDVPSGTIHPVLGRAVQAGDTIPYWSLDPANGRWKYEGRGTLEAVASGNFRVTFDATHFSYYNLDWFYSESCSQGQAINITGRPASLRYMRVDIYYVQSGQLFKQTYPSIDDNSVTYYNAPRGVPMRLVARHPLTDAVIGEVQINDLCSGGSLALSVPAVQTLTVTADLRGRCPNGIIVRPTSPIYVRDVTSNGYWRWAGYIENGRAIIHDLIAGRTYEFWGYVFLRDGFHSGTQQYRAGVDPQTLNISLDLPASAC